MSASGEPIGAPSPGSWDIRNGAEGGKKQRTKNDFSHQIEHLGMAKQYHMFFGSINIVQPTVDGTTSDRRNQNLANAV